MKASLPSRLLTYTLAAAGLAATIVPSAGAAVVFQDLFPTNGPLAGANGWFAHSGAAAKPIQILNGRAAIQQSAGSGEDVNHAFAVQGTTNKTYFSFTLNIPGGTIGTANDYFIHFRPNTPDTLNFVTRVFVGPPTAGGDYNLGVGSGSLTTTPLATWSGGLSFGTTYRVVAAYDPVGGGSQLWLNPTDESSTNINTGASATVINKPVASIAVRQATPTGATFSEHVGQVTVGTTFDDVNLTLALPGLASWGIGALAAGLVLTAAVFARRRREATALS